VRILGSQRAAPVSPATGQPATKVRVAVVGCGAIGSLYAAHLARLSEVEVWAVDPWLPHMEAIAAHGLRVVGQASFVAPVLATTHPDDIPACDLALVATKSAHTVGAVRAVAGALRDAAVASLQNGIGNEEAIAGVVPNVVRGSIVTAGHVTEPGVVCYDAPGDTWLGPFEPSPASMQRIEVLADLLTRSGLRTFAMADARGPQWTKVVFNAATSPLAALTGLTVGRVCTDPGLRHQVDRLMDEAVAVCDRSGIALTRDPREAVSEAVNEAFDHVPSMLQDIRARRPTEVDVLNGGIAAEGRRVKLPTPGHDAMVALVHGLERSWAPDAR
jgi:2-dehydropantoate 2-reductase